MLVILQSSCFCSAEIPCFSFRCVATGNRSYGCRLAQSLGAITFFGIMLLLDDVLSAVNRLSLAFQRAAVDLTIISPLLDATLMTLEKLKHEPAADFEARVKQLIARTTAEVNELHHSPEPEHGDQLEQYENDEFTGTFPSSGSPGILYHLRPCRSSRTRGVSTRQAWETA